MYMAHCFYHPAISQFLMADTSTLFAKSYKLHKVLNLISSFKLLNFVRIYGHGFYEISRTLIRKNVNNNVSKDLPIATDRKVYGTTQKVIIVDFKSLVCLLFLFSLSQMDL